MGFSNSWVAVRGVPKQILLDRLEVEDTDFPVEHDREWMTVGRNSKGWLLFCSEDSDIAERAAEVSQGGEAVACWIEEHVMASGARGFSDGREVWSVGYEEGKLDVAGEPPDILARIHKRAKAQQLRDHEVDYIFDLAPRVTRAICGFRIDTSNPPRFTALKYKPKPMSEEEAKSFAHAVKLSIKRRLNWW